MGECRLLQGHRRALNYGYVGFSLLWQQSQLLLESLGPVHYRALLIGGRKKKKENRFTRAVLSALFSIRWRQLIQRPPNFLLSILEEDWHNLRNEFERALHAGSVMEKTLLESSQIESHQQNFGSVVRIRHGELKLSGGIEVMVLDVSYMHVT